MEHLIIGAGPAGIIAAETLRRVDQQCSITVINAENEPPYSRMAIPYLLTGSIDESGAYLRRAEGHCEDLRIIQVSGRVEKIAPKQKILTLASGETRRYDRLLVASGSTPVLPPIPGADGAGIETCWTLSDARAIALGTGKGSRVVLLGAGFIGCIVLQALASRGVHLTVVEMEDRMLPRMMDKVGAAMLKTWCEKKGVCVRTSTRVDSISGTPGDLTLVLSDGSRIAADTVISAAGVRPSIDFLGGSGIAVDQGVLVNDRLESSVPDVFAAGDVAQGREFLTGRREIHAIQPTASEHGRIAALNMAGKNSVYVGSLSMNVLNTIGLISHSFGQWNGLDRGEDSILADADNFKYMRLNFDDDRLIGALTLGFTQHVGAIRGLIQSRVRLGDWRDRLIGNPTQVMEAFVACTNGAILKG
ncbi:FAD-dependent oxidoreductase [Pseudohalocynthiibacter sp. F2068]|jgi:NAD(P)H-nitrite reductase large subunit|uniref:NAD(P)/FAD-dependent oxidoreductase n=1 Tax=Pseudohalocynthiibacter sp. F2068 TaxID=2926418 RepID=UPI001FF34833|nr:FAD-dependent oxidoreductase [Pseudohalocynthiibacter sp. F2068]MCK0104425.1 FAD-dependent oxidoreductase [Pseudohalocynthiibacter sp. F2068]